MTDIVVNMVVNDRDFEVKLKRADRVLASLGVSAQRAQRMMGGFDQSASRASRGMGRAGHAARSAGKSFDDSSKRMYESIALLRDISIVGYTVHGAIMTIRQAFVDWQMALINTNAEMERLQALLGGMSSARTEMERVAESAEDLKNMLQMSKEMPFSMDSLTRSLVKLRSVDFAEPERMVRALSDAVAAFGGSDDEFKRASVALQQMGGKGVVSMEELRQQLGEAVPSAIKLMAREMEMSYGEFVKQVSLGRVDADTGLRAFMVGAEKDFKGSAERMMETWSGMLSRLKTAWSEFQLNVGGFWDGEGFFADAKQALKDLVMLMESDEVAQFADRLGSTLQNALGWIKDFVAWLVKYRDEAARVMETVAVFTMLKMSIKATTLAVSVLTATARVNPLIALGNAALVGVSALAAFREEMITIGETTAELSDWLKAGFEVGVERLTPLVEKAKETMSGVWEGAKAGFDEFLQSLDGGKMDLWQSFLNLFGAETQESILRVADRFDLFLNDGDYRLQVLNDGLNVLVASFESVGDTLQALPGLVSSFADGVMYVLEPLRKDLESISQTVVDTTLFTFERVTEAGPSYVEGLTSLYEGALSLLPESTANSVDSMLDEFSRLHDPDGGFEGFVRSTMNAIVGLDRFLQEMIPHSVNVVLEQLGILFAGSWDMIKAFGENIKNFDFFSDNVKEVGSGYMQQLDELGRESGAIIERSMEESFSQDYVGQFFERFSTGFGEFNTRLRSLSDEVRGNFDNLNRDIVGDVNRAFIDWLSAVEARASEMGSATEMIQSVSLSARQYKKAARAVAESNDGFDKLAESVRKLEDGLFELDQAQSDLLSGQALYNEALEAGAATHDRAKVALQHLRDEYAKLYREQMEAAASFSKIDPVSDYLDQAASGMADYITNMGEAGAELEMLARIESRYQEAQEHRSMSEEELLRKSIERLEVEIENSKMQAKGIKGNIEMAVAVEGLGAAEQNARVEAEKLNTALAHRLVTMAKMRGDVAATIAAEQNLVDAQQRLVRAESDRADAEEQMRGQLQSLDELRAKIVSGEATLEEWRSRLDQLLSGEGTSRSTTTPFDRLLKDLDKDFHQLSGRVESGVSEALDRWIVETSAKLGRIDFGQLLKGFDGNAYEALRATAGNVTELRSAIESLSGSDQYFSELMSASLELKSGYTELSDAIDDLITAEELLEAAQPSLFSERERVEILRDKVEAVRDLVEQEMRAQVTYKNNAMDRYYQSASEAVAQFSAELRRSGDASGVASNLIGQYEEALGLVTASTEEQARANVKLLEQMALKAEAEYKAAEATLRAAEANDKLSTSAENATVEMAKQTLEMLKLREAMAMAQGDFTSAELFRPMIDQAQQFYEQAVEERDKAVAESSGVVQDYANAAANRLEVDRLLKDAEDALDRELDKGSSGRGDDSDEEYAERLSRILNLEGQRKDMLEKTLPVVEEMSQKYKVQKELILAMMKQESNFDPDAVSHAGAQGLMQLMPGTASDLEEKLGMAEGETRRSWEANVEAGVAYISDMLNQSNNDLASSFADLATEQQGEVAEALMRYNWGPGSVDKNMRNLHQSGADALPEETAGYYRRIIGMMDELGNLSGADYTSPLTDVEEAVRSLKEEHLPAQSAAEDYAKSQQLITQYLELQEAGLVENILTVEEAQQVMQRMQAQAQETAKKSREKMQETSEAAKMMGDSLESALRSSLVEGEDPRTVFDSLIKDIQKMVLELMVIEPIMEQVRGMLSGDWFGGNGLDGIGHSISDALLGQGKAQKTGQEIGDTANRKMLEQSRTIGEHIGDSVVGKMAQKGAGEGGGLFDSLLGGDKEETKEETKEDGGFFSNIFGGIADIFSDFLGATGLDGLFDGFLGNLGGLFSGFLDGSGGLGGIFSSFLGSFGNLFSGLLGGGGGGLLSGALGSFLGPIGGVVSSILPFAKGGSFMSSLPAGVYDRPTFFPLAQPGLHAFASGTGLLGEAGPEAVLPLSRGSDGSLGVNAIGGLGGNLFGGLFDGLSGLFGGLTGSLGDIFGGLTGNLGGLFGGLTESLGGIFGALPESLGGLFGGLTENLGGLFGGLMGGLGNLGSMLSSGPRNMLNSLWAGLHGGGDVLFGNEIVGGGPSSFAASGPASMLSGLGTGGLGLGRNPEKGPPVPLEAAINLNDKGNVKSGIMGGLGNIGDMFRDPFGGIVRSLSGASGGGLFGGLSLFADGGSFLSSLPQGIYSSPTFFPLAQPGLHAFASGTGLLGEAGPEAVLPLKEGSDGTLGVSSEREKPKLNIVVNNLPGQDTEIEQDEDRLTLTQVRSAIADDIARGGSKVSRAFEKSYFGLRRGR